MPIGTRRVERQLNFGYTTGLSRAVTYFPDVARQVNPELDSTILYTSVRMFHEGKWYMVLCRSAFVTTGGESELNAMRRLLNMAYQALYVFDRRELTDDMLDPCQLHEQDRVGMEYKRERGLLTTNDAP